MTRFSKYISKKTVFLSTLVLRLLMLCTFQSSLINEDRIGDLISPAFLSGRDWSLIIPSVKYYGYGFKWIFALFYSISDDPFFFYWAIMLLYAVLYAGIAVIIYHILADYIRIDAPLFSALLSVLFGIWGESNLKSEPSLYLAGWIVLFFLVKALYAEDKKRKNTATILLVISLIYCMTLHERMLALLLAFGIFVILYALKFREWPVNPALFYPLLIIGYLGIETCNNAYRTYFWGTADVGNSSVISSGSITSFCQSIDGIKWAVKALIDNIVTLTNQTLGFGLVAIGIFGFSILLVRVKGPNAKKYSKTEKVIYAILWTYGMATAIVIAGLCIKGSNSVLSGNLYGFKNYIYGRYYLNFAYVAVFATLIWLYLYHTQLRIFFVGCFTVIYTGLSFVFVNYLYPHLMWVRIAYTPVAGTSYIPIDWPIFYCLSKGANYPRDLLINIVFSAILLLIGLLVIKANRNWFPLIILCITACIVFKTTNGFSFSMPSVEFSNIDTDSTLYDTFKEFEDNSIDLRNEPIYVPSWAHQMQYLLNRYKIAPGTPEIELKEALILSFTKPIDMNTVLDDYENYSYLQLTERHYLYIKGDRYVKLFEDAGYTVLSVYETVTSDRWDTIFEEVQSGERSAVGTISQLNGIEIQIPGVKKEYHLAIVNDLHIISSNEEIGDEYTQLVENRYDSFMTSAGIHSADAWYSMASDLNDLLPDVVVFNGDMVDFASKDNYAILTDGIEQIEAPIMYIRADHDRSLHYTSHLYTSEDAAQMQASISADPEISYYDFGSFGVIGISNSNSSISSEGLSYVKELLNNDQPIILFTHVPFDSAIDTSFRETVYKIRDSYNIWGSQDRYVPDENEQELIDLITASDSPVQAVISAHLHFSYEVQLTDTITEYVLGPAFESRINMLTVTSR